MTKEPTAKTCLGGWIAGRATRASLVATRGARNAARDARARVTASVSGDQDRSSDANARHRARRARPPDAVRSRGSLGTLVQRRKRRIIQPTRRPPWTPQRFIRARARRISSRPLGRDSRRGSGCVRSRVFAPVDACDARRRTAEVPFPRRSWKLSHRGCENAHPSQPRSDADARRPDDAGAVRDEGHRAPRAGEEAPGGYRV